MDKSHETDNSIVRTVPGLSDSEAEQSRLAHGRNVLAEKERETFMQKIIDKLRSPEIVILIIAAGVSLFMSALTQFKIVPGEPDWLEGICIIGAILVSTVYSTMGEYRQDGRQEKLKADADRIYVKAYRNGMLAEILIDDVVAGDYLLIQSGDLVPADGWLMCGHIKVNNASLNGESDDCKKFGAGEDFIFDDNIDIIHPNKMYRGSITTNGEGIMKVAHVGRNTEMGRMAESMNTKVRPSPLTVKLKKLAKTISVFGYGGGAVNAVASVIQSLLVAIPNTWNGWVELAFKAASLGLIIIVMAVPEGLPLMIALVLGLNMKRMLDNNIFVKKMLGIETAGSLKIVFSDKTGTITKGILQVIEFFTVKPETDEVVVFTEFKELRSDENLYKTVVTNMLKNNGAEYDAHNNFIGGNATDRALLSYILNRFDKEDEKCKDYGPIDAAIDTIDLLEVETFDSRKKYSSARCSDGKTYYKGAPEILLPYLTLSESTQTKLLTYMDELAGKEMRILCLAVSNEPITEGQLPSDLSLTGFVAIRDDVRPEAVEAIAEIKKAGIHPVMVTGDKLETARAIGKESGLLTADVPLAYSQTDIDNMTDDELREKMFKIGVIARATPMTKLRLVNVAQSEEVVVGMTGDGVNDAPALHQADVGFAMGSGTEAAKGAGDIILLDDNFKSIYRAVLYGRTIFKNIQKFCKFQLSINVSAVLSSLIGISVIGVQPMTVIQFLWVNMMMDTLGAAAFGNEPALAEYMREKPTSRGQNILDRPMVIDLIASGFVMTVIGLGILLFPIAGIEYHSTQHLTMFFTYFIFASLANGLTIRVSGLNIFQDFGRNPSFLKVFGAIALIQTAIVVIPEFVPVVGRVMGTASLGLTQWAIVVGCAFAVIPFKLLVRYFTMDKAGVNIQRKKDYAHEVK